MAMHLINNAPAWTKNCPRHMKVGAVVDAYKARRTAWLKYKATGERSELKFRSKKQPKQSVLVIARSVKKDGPYPRLLGKMQMLEALPAKLQGKGKKEEREHWNEIKDSRITCMNGEYSLVVPYLQSVKPREPSRRVVALDPGVRTFLTMFFEEGFGWLGRHDIGRIQRLCQHCDNLLSRATQVKRPLRRTLRKAANKIRSQIRNLVDELHHKVAHFL